MSTEEIQEIISRTIKELQFEEGAVQFKKPKTFQGWVYIALGIATIVGFCWTSIVFLNDIARHQEQDYHAGTVEIMEKIQSNHTEHIDDNAKHQTDVDIELKIIKEVSPIKEDLTSIKQNIKGLEQNVRDVQQDIRDVQRTLQTISDRLH